MNPRAISTNRSEMQPDSMCSVYCTCIHTHTHKTHIYKYIYANGDPVGAWTIALNSARSIPNKQLRYNHLHGKYETNIDTNAVVNSYITTSNVILSMLLMRVMITFHSRVCHCENFGAVKVNWMKVLFDGITKRQYASERARSHHNDTHRSLPRFLFLVFLSLAHNSCPL